MFGEVKSISKVTAEYGELDARTLSYLKTVKDGKVDIDAFKKHQISMSQAFKETHGNLSGITTALKSFGKNLLSIGINMVAFTVASMAIGKAFEWIDGVINKQKHLAEAASDARQKYEDTKSSISDLNAELEENNKKIAEIQSKGSLTFTEQSELNKLENANASLENQIALLEKRKAIEQEEAALATAKELQSRYTNDGSAGTKGKELNTVATNSGIKKANNIYSFDASIQKGNDMFSDQKDDINVLLAGYKDLNKQLELYDKSSEDWKSANDGLTKSSQYLTDNMSDISTSLSEMKESYDYISGLDANGTILTSNQKDILDTYNELERIYNSIFKTIDYSNFQEVKFDEIFNTDGIELTKRELLELQRTGELKDLDLSQYKNLQSAMKKAGLSSSELKKQFEALVTSPEKVYDYSAYVDSFASTVEGLEKIVEDFNAAIDDSVDSTGLASESIMLLAGRFASLESYNPDKLFERTSTGIRLNSDELRKLNSEYKNNHLTKFSDKLSQMRKDYQALCLQIANTTDEHSKEKIALIETRDALGVQIDSVEELKSQYEGLTSAWSEWERAMESANEGSNYDNLFNKLEDIKELYKKNLIGTDDFRASVQLMTTQDVSLASIDELVRIYGDRIGVLNEYFTEGQEGCDAFVDKLIEVSKKAGKSWAAEDSEGNVSFKIPNEELTELADKMKLSEEAVEQIFNKLKEYGATIEFSNENNYLKEVAEEAKKAKDNLSGITEKGGDVEKLFNNISLDDSNLSSLEDVNNQLEIVNELRDEIKKSGLFNEDEIDSNLAQLDQVSNYLSTKIGQMTNDVQITFNVDSSLDELDKCVKTVEKINNTDLEFNFLPGSIKEAETEIEKANELLNTFKNSDGNIDLSVEGATEAVTILSNLIRSKEELQNPVIMNVDTSQLSGEMQSTVEKLQEYREAINNLNTINQLNAQYNLNLDTSQAQAEVSSALQEVQGSDKTILADLKVDPSSTDTLNATLQSMSPELMVKAGINEDAIKGYKPEDKNAVVKYDLKETEDLKTFRTKNHDLKANITYSYVTVGSKPSVSNVSGTAHASGTAKAKGDWRTDESGTALGGELGEEIVVRNGKWFTIGTNGAEFFDYQKDDIIFNHKQSKQLLTNGNIYSRGRFAKANGSAFAEGNAFAIGGSYSKSTRKKSSSSSKKKSSKSKSSNSKSSSSEKSFEDTFDWVDRALNLVDKVVKRLSNAVENVYRDWSDRNQKIGEEIGQLGAQMNYYQSAYNTYMNKANSIPLAENYKQMVRDGNWSIQTITDENLAKQIKEYQDWYDKAEDCQTKLEEIREEIGATYKKQFDNIAKEFENRIGELEASLTNLDNKFELSKYKESGINNNYLQEQIPLHQSKVSELTKEINALQSQLQNAVNSGLVGIYSEGYQEMVSTINDLKNDLICAQEDISKVYEEMFDNIANKYDSQIEYIDEYISQVEKYANLAESKGMLATASYYELMLAYQKENLENLELERKALAENLQSALDSQSVVVGSEKWYEFQQQINEVDSAIIDANQSIQDFMNSIRDLEWDNFDYLQDTISQITTEMDFLLDLMSNQKLFDDNGNQTEYGKAAEALHGVNYNTFMSQSDEYAKSIKELDAQYADDSLNKDYLERRQELVELQQDMILNAQDEKEAIKDLVREGYEAQLDAFKKLIDLKTQLLDKNKDLYDYEKAIIEKTQALANIQKQLGAYSGDSSEEGKKTVQELKLELQNAKDDLEETEYEKYISDQQAILDNFADEFESWFTERLDNFDATFSEIIDRINANSAEVGETIKNAADKVGYDLSDSFNTIFNSKDGEITNVISKYDENFSNRMTTLQSAIDAIKIGIDYMSAEAKAEAERKAAEQKAKEEAIKRQQEIQKQQEAERQQQQQQQNQQQQQQQQPQPSDDRNIFVHKRDSYPKGKLQRYLDITWYLYNMP